jgi:hypothetical protein
VRDNGDIANILAHDFYVGLRTTQRQSLQRQK